MIPPDWAAAVHNPRQRKRASKISDILLIFVMNSFSVLAYAGR
jgi:hypothetical protein